MNTAIDSDRMAEIASILANAKEAVNGSTSADTSDDEWPDGATWRITFAGQQWHSTDVLAIHACAVGELLGSHGWDNIHPSYSPAHLTCWIAALLSAQRGIPAADVLTEVYRTPLEDLRACLEVADGD